MATPKRSISPLRIMAELVMLQRRRLFWATIVVVLLANLLTRYSVDIPALRPVLASLPYVQLDVIDQAEFFLIIACTGVVIGLRSGLPGLAIMALAAVPLIYTPLFFDHTAAPNQIRDFAFQVGVILVIGYLVAALYEAEVKRRQALSLARSLRETDEMKTNFLSLASHELRTPLTSLVGFSQLLQVEEPLTEERRQWLEWIHRESLRLSGIVTEMLDVSRIQSGRLRLRRERVDLSSLVSEAMRSIGLAVDRHRIVLDAPADLPAIVGDHDKLMQVLINLVSNAVKYSPNGGEVRIAARERSDSKQIVVTIVDQGVGIPVEEQPRLFGTFYRVRQPETENIPGVGLGLYVAKVLIERMGGDISLESQVGKGTTVTVALPIHEGWVDVEAEGAPFFDVGCAFVATT